MHRRSRGRLLLAQFLYQSLLTNDDPSKIIKDNNFFAGKGVSFNKNKWEEELFDYWSKNNDKINEIAKEYIDESKRKDIILKVLLESAICELLLDKEIPIAVVIKEYTDLGNKLFPKQSLSVVTGVLDKIGRDLKRS